MNDDIVCHTCQTLKASHQYPCVVCNRDMYYNKCFKCDNSKPLVLDSCSPKCKQILIGDAHIVPIQYNHDTFIIIEEFDEFMGLKVTNHAILKKVLTYEQKEKLKKKCTPCKNEYRLLPYKCWSCKEVYTYEVECEKCYNKNGYLCDECDFEING